MSPGGATLGTGSGSVTCHGGVTDGTEATVATPVKCVGAMAGIPATAHNTTPHATRGRASESRASLPHLTAVHLVVPKIADPTAEGTDRVKRVATAIERLYETRKVPIEIPGSGTMCASVKGGHLNCDKVTPHPAANRH